MDVKFFVVEHDGKKMFRISGDSSEILVKTLRAFVLECRAPCYLRLYRDSPESVGSIRVYTEGTHGPVTYFDAEDFGFEFNRVSGERDLTRLDVLNPGDFRAGDQIVLTVETPEEGASVFDDLKVYKNFFEKHP